MAEYLIRIVVQGEDRASGPLKSVGGALGNMAQIAGGIIGANFISKITDGFGNMARAALESYAGYERLGSSLTSLVAKEIQNSELGVSMAEAMEQAAGKAEDLQGWIQKLAIESPFTQSGVADAFRTAMAYGFTATESQRLTSAMIDFASGSGANESAMGRIALALGQIQAKGKLAGGEVLQLTEAGLNVREILAKAFGVSTQEIVAMQEKGLIPAKEAIDAIVSSMETDFAGAAKKQAGTFSGLLSSLQDIKSVGLRELFTGTFQAVQPYVQKFVDVFSSEAFMANLRSFGERIGQGLTTFITKAQEISSVVGPIIGNLVKWFQENLPGAISTTYQWFSANLLPVIQYIADWYTTSFEPALSRLWTWFQENIPGALATSKAFFEEHIFPVFNKLWEIIAEKEIPIILDLVTWFTENLPSALEIAQGYFDNVIIPAASRFWDFLSQNVIPIVEKLRTWFQENLPPALEKVSAFLNDTLVPAFNSLWEIIDQYVWPIIDELLGIVGDLIELGFEALAGIWENVLRPALEDLWSYLSETLGPIFEDFVTWLGDVTGGIDGIKTTLGEWLGALKELRTALANIKLPDWLTPGSPTPLELGLKGISSALNQISNTTLPRFDSRLGNLPNNSAGQLASVLVGNVGNVVILAQPGQDGTALYRQFKAELERDIRDQNNLGLSKNRL